MADMPGIVLADMATIMDASLISVPHTEPTSACMIVGTVVTSVVLATALHASPVAMTDQAEWDTAVVAASMEVGITATSMDVGTMVATATAAGEVLTDDPTMVTTTAIRVVEALTAIRVVEALMAIRVVETSMAIVNQLTPHATRDV